MLQSVLGSVLARVGLPGVILLALCAFYPPLIWVVGILIAIFGGIYGILLGSWMLIPYIPLMVFIWWSWDAITAFGFLGYWGILGLVVLPIFFLIDKALDSREYMFTGMSTLIWLAIGSLYSLIAYWDVAKFVLGASFLIGCAYVLIESSKGEKENA